MYSLLDLALQEHQAGRLAAAAALYQKILADHPNEPTALHMLGVIAGQSGQWQKAVELIQRSLAILPGDALAHSNLAKLFFDQGDFGGAVASARVAVDLDPDLAEAQYNLGNALYSSGALDEAVECFLRAIALRPDYAKAHHNLANALKDRGEMEDAVASARRVVELRPDISESHSNLIFTMLFHSEIDPMAIRAECRRFDERHAQFQRTAITADEHRDSGFASKPIRIGYVSPNFREHCQSLFTLPLLRHHDHGQFHITLYSDTRAPDAATDRIRACADQWHDTGRLSHAELATLIQKDRIDILVDLTMHMAHNRLQVFARKPAPVQVCWLAYPGTTGLTAMDYRLTDPHLDPPEHASRYSETSVHLPHTFWCYDPQSNLPISPLPALTTGRVTFGCLNNFCKLTRETLNQWADILRRVPQSRLMLLAPAGISRQRVLQTLMAQNVASDRIVFVDFLPREEYLMHYQRIDIALDTFPVNGHTTSLDALWMGVPVVTQVASDVLGRAGLSQLTHLKLTELIAGSPEQFVHIASTLALDVPRLTQLRTTLRQRLEASPLMDGKGFAHDVESAYRDMYRRSGARHSFVR